MAWVTSENERVAVSVPATIGNLARPEDVTAIEAMRRMAHATLAEHPAADMAATLVPGTKLPPMLQELIREEVARQMQECERRIRSQVSRDLAYQSGL